MPIGVPMVWRRWQLLEVKFLWERREKIHATCCGCKGECNLCFCRCFRQVIVTTWCGMLVYRLMTSMVAHMAFLGR